MQANKLFLSLAGGATLLVAAGSAMAQIAVTKHNLGTGQTSHPNAMSTAAPDATSEICVFCHTPHGADTSAPAPLWNRKLPTSSYTTYDQLGTATFDAKVATGGIGSVSLACLSCHDGGQTFNQVLNAPGGGGYSSTGTATAGFQNSANALWVEFASMPTTGGDAILNLANNLGQGTTSATSGSGDLRDDHPVSIEYCGGPGTLGPGANCRDADFKNWSSATINGAQQFWVDTAAGTTGAREKTDLTLYRRTFGTDGTQPSIECASCHDPHIDNTTFLRMVAGTATGNAGSQVCLACHIK